MAGEDARINQLIVAAIDLSYKFPFEAPSGDVDPVCNTLLALKENFRPYKTYAALISLSTLNAPKVLNSDFGATTFAFTNPSNGTINIVPSTAIFTANKTALVCGSYNNSGQPYFVTGVPVGDSLFILKFTLYDGTSTGTPNFSDTFIEIRVYN